MKPRLEKIISPLNQSFYVRDIEEKYFSSPWHFHPETEIILITEGYGTRLVGDSVENFYPGDLCLIGANTPHVFLSHSDFHEIENPFYSRAICIQFEDDFWGERFTGLDELRAIKGLLASSARGIRFVKDTRKLLEEMILNFPGKSGIHRITHLLEVLDIMTSGKDRFVLSSPDYGNIHLYREDIDRMEKLYDFVFQNFTRKITIEEVSGVLNISKHSFCRYFKSRTNKMFSEFLSEVRVGNACKLLIENRLSVSQVCYESGYRNVSNFYRQFKEIKKVTPSEFRNKYLRKL
jgi:AraC-like DNA-binding protein